MSKPIEFRHAYSVPSREGDLLCKDPSLAQQQFGVEVDINVMLERFGVTGQMPTSVRLPSYGDFTQVTDFRSGLHTIMHARDEFMKLPAKLRSRFQNDPQQFMDFCLDKGNLDELRKLGLAPAPQDVGGSGAKPSDPPAGGSGPAGAGSTT